MQNFRRAFDIGFSVIGLCLSAPVIVLALIGVWLQDFRNPIYASWRLGRHEKRFRFFKIRTMVVNASKSGRHNIGADDPNVTGLGSFLRKAKIDELLQFWSIIAGHMSLVGPRPNIPENTKLYTAEERVQFSVNPGLTDFASIIFSDQGNIIAGEKDTNAAYDQLIRPWKSRLGLIYVANSSLWLDLQLMALTAINFIYRPLALAGVSQLLTKLGAPDDLIEVATRRKPLTRCRPPGETGRSEPQISTVPHASEPPEGIAA